MFEIHQSQLHPTDVSRIYFVCSLLTGKALDWATAIWNNNGSAFSMFNDFLQCFCEVFGIPEGSKDAGDQLLSVRQGRNMAAENALSFHKLSPQIVWVDDTLTLLFYKCLNLDMN